MRESWLNENQRLVSQVRGGGGEKGRQGWGEGGRGGGDWGGMGQQVSYVSSGGGEWARSPR